MASSRFDIDDAIAERFRTWCRDEGLPPKKTVEDLIVQLIEQPIVAHRDKAGVKRAKLDNRKPWELPAFYGDAATSRWSHDQELFARLKLARDLFDATDEDLPLAQALLSEIKRLEQVLKLSSVRYRGEV